MSNIKEVQIHGEISFNCGDHDAEGIALLGTLNLPSFGLRITYGRTRMVPNEYGGKTTMYSFQIGGEEAVRAEWVQNAVSVLRRVGAVHAARFRDVELNTGWEQV